MNFQPISPAPGFWSDDEIERIEEFLLDEATGLDNPMEASSIDGLFCALLSGPGFISPLQALRWVYDCEQGEQEPVFASAGQAQAIMGLLMQQWNALADALLNNPMAYQPLCRERQLCGAEPVPMLDDWCFGYHTGMRLDMAGWAPLLAAQPAWFATILRHGTEEGWALLRAQPPSADEYRAEALALEGAVRAIHAYWLAQRPAAPGFTPAPPTRRTGPKVGRNDACPCGSGRKYKHCHGAN